ncbi:MAG: hypothetical protein HYY24_28955 [Verrucomicrobia bacterium]|nr:hypothetical protein [Verrucomicrobiota bacterium]
MFTTRNAVVVALMQISVIVSGVLGAGVLLRILERVPASTRFLVDYGVALLAIPLIWISAAVVVRSRSAISESTKSVAFWLGLALLLALMLFVANALIGPWLGMDGGIGDAHEV